MAGNGLSPMQGTKTLTLTDIQGDAIAPTLLITRPPMNPDGADGYSIVQNVNTLVTTMVSTAQSLSQNVGSIFKKDSSKKHEKASKKRTEESTAKVNAMLDQIRDDLTGVVERGIKQSVAQLPRMTAEQQRELIEFWKQIKSFISSFLKWFDQMMDNMVKKLLEGYEIDTRLMAQIFDVAIAQLHGVVTENSLPIPSQQLDHASGNRQPNDNTKDFNNLSKGSQPSVFVGQNRKN